MPNPLAILPNAVSQSQPQVIYGEVSSVLPAPSSFGAPLYVTRPGWDAGAGFFWTFTDWPACHGSTLPAQGAACVLVVDTSGALRCVWWDSATTEFAPTGAAGGDLSGTFPDPTVAKVQGTPVSASAPSSDGQAFTWNGSEWAPSTATLLDASGNSSFLQRAGGAGATQITCDDTAVTLISAGASSFPQLQSSHEAVIDDNGGSLYSVSLGTIGPGGATSASFTTSRGTWTAAVPIGAILGGSGGGYLTWYYTLSGNTFTIHAANPFSGNEGPASWVGYVMGH